MKRRIRLTESDLNKIVRRSLKEYFFLPGGQGSVTRDMGFEELEEIHQDASKVVHNVSNLINNPKYGRVKKKLNDLAIALERAGDIFMDIEYDLGIY